MSSSHAESEARHSPRKVEMGIKISKNSCWVDWDESTSATVSLSHTHAMTTWQAVVSFSRGMKLMSLTYGLFAFSDCNI